MSESKNTKEAIDELQKSLSVKKRMFLGAPLQKNQPEDVFESLAKSLQSEELKTVRLAFEVNPSDQSNFDTLYIKKQRLLPDNMLKQLAIKDDLVAAIVQTRQRQIAAFGRPRPDRHSIGFTVELLQEAQEKIDAIEDPKEKKRYQKEIQEKIAELKKRILACGDKDALGITRRLAFNQYLSESVRNLMVVGRMATEVVWRVNREGKEEFACFRVIDAGTIYMTKDLSEYSETVRQQAISALDKLNHVKIIKKRYLNGEYKWMQVIDDQPRQAFTPKECLVMNYYRVPDVELKGYPVTPIDTMVSAVSTHLNIIAHNKLYFQNGRATRGMLVIESDDADQDTISQLRQQFNASINSVSNSWRMPVFSVGQGDKVQFMPLDSGARDMEFQYLTDQNARVILSAYQMSPDELPGWSYLSRGTNSQAISESNSEWRLIAARDVGLRPLLGAVEDFINDQLLPLIDSELAKICVLKFVGLDSDNAEKEAVKLQNAQQLYMGMDDILVNVEKRPLGRDVGGEFPFNPNYQAVLDKYLTVGQILERFFGHEGASKDPQFAYVRDAFWFQNREFLYQQELQKQQMAMQQQAMQQQAQGQQQEEKAQSEDQGDKQQEAGQPSQEESAQKAEDLTRTIDQAIGLLSKAEKNLPASKMKIVHHQKQVVNRFLRGFEEDLEEAEKEIIDTVKQVTPKKDA